MDIYDKYRYLSDEEIPDAMKRITSDSHFGNIARFVYPDMSVEEASRFCNGFRSIAEVQQGAMCAAVDQVLHRTVTEFTYSGLERLERDKNYLFVSNHRDITLDAMLLQYVLLRHGFASSRIVIGANLLCMPVIEDLGLINKTLSIRRGGGCREFYNELSQLSEYIRYELTERGESVWIAQRNGRTKDGKDRTDPAVIKMFSISGSENRVDALDSLHIVPVSISYEWEPCDILKAVARCRSRCGAYQKAEGEDLNSIITGLLAPKGRVHLSIDEPLSRKDVEQVEGDPKRIATLMDERIDGGRKNWKTNALAKSILERNESQWVDSTLRKQFEERMALLQCYEDCDQEVLRQYFLEIYANALQ